MYIELVYILLGKSIHFHWKNFKKTLTFSLPDENNTNNLIKDTELYIDYKSIIPEVKDNQYDNILKIPVIYVNTEDDIKNTPIYYIKDKEQFGHGQKAIGYDFENMALLVENSWGTNWGDKGYFYMPFDIVKPNMSSDYWIIKSVNNP